MEPLIGIYNGFDSPVVTKVADNDPYNLIKLSYENFSKVCFSRMILETNRTT